MTNTGLKLVFALTGAVNALATNLTLQLLLLLCLPAGVCTLFSQLVNGSLGYFLYSTWVFRFTTLRNRQSALRYGSLQVTLWILNWILILSGLSIGLNRNIAAALSITPLAAISYLIQKRWVFKKT